MTAVKNLCTRAIVLENGQIAYSGETNDAVNFYLTQNKSNIGVELIDRLDRSGKGNFLFKNITVKTNINEPQTNLLSGESYKFQIAYTAKKDIVRTGIRLIFKDSREQIRFLLNNNFILSDSLNLSKTAHGELSYTIEKLPLPRGVYTVQLTCFSEEGVEDNIENAFEFSVIGGDYYNSGKEQISKEGVLIDYDFELLK